MIHNQWKEIRASRDWFMSETYLRMDWLCFLLSTNGTRRLIWQFRLHICWFKTVLLQMIYAFKTNRLKNKSLLTDITGSAWLVGALLKAKMFSPRTQQLPRYCPMNNMTLSIAVNVSLSFIKVFVNHSTSSIHQESPYGKEFHNSSPQHSDIFQGCNSWRHDCRNIIHIH